ncbi:glycoside hydrolase family 114 protein [Cucurbitaria berberidis CBS 394.84]|uniref:alpha-galactosidase n=1 Tax=Cucurbitaria berberidis CBS 394.84 TaxID=1168544 RepID=A0A9P4LEX9_9PLEO|nr:glycoside hydrolase family 114 protein [Cucurbitaria berberidis CBS 394.84]KAF1851494.1 glycoside hydrolase family 114 protein [Cucurbitaria berberidis CBS 394.84]
MSIKPASKRPWSLRLKLLLGGLAAIIILGLALGLGLGLTIGQNGDDDDGDSNNPPTSTRSPLPSPNTTLPWVPRVNDTWQIILSHPPLLSSNDKATTPNVSIFDIDLFDTPTETIKQLHDLGKKVICYFSAGSYEEWRPDAGQFQPADLGKNLDGWPGEKWLKVGNENVRRIMKSRVEMAKEKGCDGVDPDNVDGYQNKNGLSLTQDDAIEYLSYLSSIARPLNLTLGLKNAGDIIPVVLPVVEFSVNEQCVEYGECDTFQPFIEDGKPVFNIEYPKGAGEGEAQTHGLKDDVMEKFCERSGGAAASAGFSTVLKQMELGGWVEYCDGKVEVTAVNATVGNRGQSR